MAKDTRKKASKSKTKSKLQAGKLPKHLEQINLMAAGIDIGSMSHFVAVPEGCAEEECVREFKSFTPDLHALVVWLTSCGIETVAMESTGVYWIPLYELLESEGFEVLLVDARKVKNVSGRKSDVLDCQWLQQLHTYGLLSGAFRPNEPICQLRAYVRQREMLIRNAARHIQHMQKALVQMNVQLHNVLSDMTGRTGMKMIRAIVAGEREPKVLASYRHKSCKNSLETIEKSLTGSYREEHIFALTQAVELYDTYQEKLLACDKVIEQQLQGFEPRVARENTAVEGEANATSRKRSASHCKNEPKFELSSYLIQICGVDLTGIPGLEATSSLKVVSEIGLNLTRWRTSKQFASWLGLCPGNKVSGGKVLSSRSKRCPNNAASILRMAASTLHGSNTALGSCYRRLRSRLGAPKAITAMAHKLAIIIYNMLREGVEYSDLGADYYEKQYRKRSVKNLRKRAEYFGFTLVETSALSRT